jgi:uncharacterized protein
LSKKKTFIFAAIFLAVFAAAFLLGMNIGGRKISVTDSGPGFVRSVSIKDFPMLALVIDDVGYSGKNFEAIKELGIPVTLAVLPGLIYSERACEMAGENRLGLILHLPMEPKTGKWAREESTVMAGMSGDDVEAILDTALGSVVTASGVSNHMGSKATEDEKAVGSLMKALKKRDLFFLDSFTTPFSVCARVAGAHGVRYLKRDIFIDNIAQESSIREMLNEAGNAAIRRGWAIAIGHDREKTIEAIKREIPALLAKGIRFVTLEKIAVLTEERQTGVF